MKNTIEVSLKKDGRTVSISYCKKRLIEDYEHYVATSLVIGRDPKTLKQILKNELFSWHKELANTEEKFHKVTYF